MTAELVLNLIWLAVAAVAAAWLAVWCSRQPRGTRILPAVVATVCLVAILFPIISETDDLSAGFVLTETSTLRRIVNFVTVAAAVPAIVDTALVFRSLCLQLALLTPGVAIVTVARPGFATVFSFRGPPAAALR